MSFFAGPLWVFSALLVGAGAMKLSRPDLTAGAMRQSGLMDNRLGVRLLGIAEIGIGVWAIAFGTTAFALALTTLYLGFTGFVVNALVRDLPVASCGCFGREETPSSWIHVAVTSLGMVAGVAVALRPPDGIDQVLAHLDISPILFVSLVLLAIAFAYMSLTTLPKTLGVAKRS